MFPLSRWLREVWTARAIALSVDLFALYVNCRGSKVSGREAQMWSLIGAFPLGRNRAVRYAFG